jgi:hypothetical protein
MSPTTLLAMDQEALVVLCVLAIAGMFIYVVRTIKDVKETREREQTKREVAAYVAEGSIRPQDAASILNAGGPAQESSQAEQTIASAVAWGTISPAKASDLLKTLRTNPPRDGAASEPKA